MVDLRARRGSDRDESPFRNGRTHSNSLLREEAAVSGTGIENKEVMVGAPRFELGTSCAQGRRATRLRYAPTVATHYSTVLLDLAAIALALKTSSVSHARIVGDGPPCPKGRRAPSA